jgi:hypothetical protein
MALDREYVQLVQAAVESGITDILKVFLDFGGNYSSPDEHNWTAYMTASQSRNTFAIEKFTGMIPPSFSSVLAPRKWAGQQVCGSIQLQGNGVVLLYSGKAEHKLNP